MFVSVVKKKHVLSITYSAIIIFQDFFGHAKLARPERGQLY
jgi:hypothetical protein